MRCFGDGCGLLARATILSFIIVISKMLFLQNRPREVNEVARSHLKIWGGLKYFDFKRATVFCLGHRLSKHKTT